MKHACVKNLGHIAAIETVEVCIVKRHRNFDCAVAAEVEEYHAVVVVHCADGFAVLDNNECRQILVDNAGVFRTVSLDCVRCGCKSPALSVNVGVEALFDHIPVCEISVHGDDHSAAAACDACVKVVVVELFESRFEHINVNECACCGNISAVKQNVDAHVFDSACLCALHESDKVTDVAVHVAVREQSDEMHRRAVIYAIVLEFLPCGRIENIAAFDCFFNEFCALRIDLSATECVVSHFAVAHIVVAGKTDCRAVRLDIGVGAFFEKCVERRSVCQSDCVAKSRLGLSYAVHNDQNKFFHIILPFEKI